MSNSNLKVQLFTVSGLSTSDAGVTEVNGTGIAMNGIAVNQNLCWVNL
jgi:hypothetical protein